MNKITFAISILGMTTLLSCNRTDFSTPEDVIKTYRILSEENKNENLYKDFLSSKSKEFVTKDEFIKARNIPDSSLKSTTLLNRKVSSYPVDVNISTYRRWLYFKNKEYEMRQSR